MAMDFWSLLAGFGKWLRALSLSGGRGNLLAWGIVLGLTALPALGLLWKGRSRWDWLLMLAAGEIFAGLYFLVNSSLLTAQYEAGAAWGGIALWGVLAAILAWTVLRWLGRIGEAERPGRTLERLLRGAAMGLGLLTVLSALFGLTRTVRETAAANTASGWREMMPAYAVLAILTIADLLPALLGYQMLAWSGKLARKLDEDPFGEETLAAAEKISRGCARIACLSVLFCAGGNLLQMLTFPLLRSVQVRVYFPLTTVLLALALSLLCRYFRRAKAVSDDNETII